MNELGLDPPRRAVRVRAVNKDYPHMKKILVLVTLFGLSLVANAKEPATETAPINDTCPISGKAADPSETVSVDIEFCCNRCKGKFDKDPAAHLAKAAGGEAGKCIFNGKPAKKKSTLKIALCCGKCPDNFDRKKHLGKVKLAKKDS